MIKAIGIVIIILTSSGLGFIYANDLKKRILQMKSLKKIIIMLDGEIKYANAQLPEAFYSMSKRLEQPFAEFFLKVSEELRAFEGATFREVWNRHVETNLDQTRLTIKDKSLLKSLGENMGYLDREMQHNSITLYLEQLEKEIEEAECEVQTKTKVYHSLGVMGGLFLAIILI